MAEQPIFKRIVLGLSCNKSGRGMHLAAEIARLLQLDLVGLFVEEEGLLGLAALPFAREFQLLGGGWRPLDIDQLSRDLQIASKSVERDFTETAKTLQTTCQFEVVRGRMAEALASISRAGDIVLLAEPTSPAERATSQFPSVLDAVFHSAAAVLLVPSRIIRGSGAIVAIATEKDDPSIDAAKAIAAAAKEELIVIEPFRAAGRAHPSAPYAIDEIQIPRISAAKGERAPLSMIWSAMHQVRERLVVIARSDENLLPSSIASMRHVPVLIVEPPTDKREGGR